MSNEEKTRIQKTASTLFDLIEHSDVAYGEKIAELMIKETGIEWPRISVKDFSAFPVARFHTNQTILDFFTKQYGDRLQIIELGAGFTSHFFNLSNKIGKYIEVELAVNSALKEKIISKLKKDDNHIFIAGDILEVKTWSKIKKEINFENPVIIFSEGVISQYFNDEQKAKMADLVKDFLIADGSCIIFDDTLRNHQELHDNNIIKEGMSKIVIKSGSSVFKSEFQTFDQEITKWKQLLNKKIITVDYILSKPEMDFAIEKFKLIICLNNSDQKIVKGLEKLSIDNSQKRIWK